MRRIYILPLLLLLSLTAMIVMAQDEPSPDSPVDFGSTPEPTQATENYFMGLNNSPLTISAGEGSDFCDSATSIDTGQGGTQMDVAALTQSSDDPILNCMWGSPSSTKGYRTVWYQFTPDFNGIMTLSTLPASTLATNAYDTVLAVHTGSCGSLTTLACSDDTMGFSSTVTMNIRRNVTYFIEVADWQAGGNAIKTLDLSLQIDPFDTNWQTQTQQLPILTSRHASVVIGTDIYLMGGRGSSGSLVRNLQKLNTTTGTWTSLTSMPGDGLLNTTAVYLPPGNNTGSNGRIYVPGGSIQSSDQAYSREHMFFDLGIGAWSPGSIPAIGEVGGSHVSEAFAYAAAARNNANDAYFLTGGVVGQGYPFTTTSTVTNQVLFYQPAEDDWYVREPMNSPRYGHVAANVNGKLCVAGGLNIDGGQHVLIPDGECASGISPSSWGATGKMNFPRYFAHSSVGPDGKWYVYGGIGTDSEGFQELIPEVEVYDPDTNSWTVLGLLYDVGGQNGQPIVWPGGGFAGNYLWLAGGSYDPSGNYLNPQVEKVQILEGSLYLPLILNDINANNHSFSNAKYMTVNSAISQNFGGTRELVNVYQFDVNQLSTINVALTSVASNANVNLYLFNDNKQIIENDESPFPGIDKTITVPLSSGHYYVMVRYKSSFDFPNDLSDYYQLRVSK